MRPPHSAGILLFRTRDAALQVLLIRPGGPFWRKQDAGAWMIPKGTHRTGRGSREAALREFEEETGTRLSSVPFAAADDPAGGGKVVAAFALEGDLEPGDGAEQRVRNVEWPPRERSAPALPRSRRGALDEHGRGAGDDALPSQLPSARRAGAEDQLRLTIRLSGAREREQHPPQWPARASVSQALCSACAAAQAQIAIPMRAAEPVHA
jgi:predicted NUDIX family NTP pyrophosphohydrolase